MSTKGTLKFDWYQTETYVVVEIRVKGADPNASDCKFSEKALTFSTVVPQSSANYELDFRLAHPICAEESVMKVTPSKVELKLKKKEGLRWSELESKDASVSGENNVPGPESKQAASQPPSYISTKGKDWSKIEKDIAEELGQENPEGDAALQSLFSSIYKDADEDVKRAMVKSFQESGGTVLSTNWSEVGKGRVEVKPPDGMEFKKWDS